MKRLLAALLIISFVLTLFACSNDGGESSAASSAADESGANVNLSKNDETSYFHEQSNVDESLTISDFSLRTNMSEYDFNDIVTLTLTVNSKHRFIYDDYYEVEYFDGEWKKCEAEYIVTDFAYYGRTQAKIEFKLSERADKGKEKYRVKLSFILENGKYDMHTVYSNEFYIKD